MDCGKIENGRVFFTFQNKKIMTLYFFKKPILVVMMKSFGNTNGEINYIFRMEKIIVKELLF